MIKPVLCFGSDIWGFEYSSIIKKVHTDFCRRICCLDQNTADFFALSECGRYLLYVTYMT